jgi:hypothetical protein
MGSSQERAPDWGVIGPIEELVGDGSLSGYEQKRLFHQLADGHFEECAFAEGLDSRLDGRSFAPVDLDGDGDVDLLLLSRNAPFLQFFRNDGPNGKALEIELRATHGASEAPSAKVRVKTGAGERLFPVLLQRGYMTSVEPAVHVGLGDETAAQVSVEWRSGVTEDLGRLLAGGRYLAVEGSGAKLARAFSPATAQAVALPPLRAQLFAPGLSGARVIPLMASWCKACWAEAAHLNRIAAAGDWGVRVIAFEPSASVAAMRDKMHLKVDAEAVGSEREALLAQWGVTELPAMLVFGADGKLERIARGADRIEEILEEIRPAK